MNAGTNSFGNLRVALSNQGFPLGALLASLAILGILVGISQHNFLLFHGLVEVLSIAVAWLVFALAWNTRHYARNQMVLLLGIFYLFVGGLDLVHVFTYRGMDVFSWDTTDAATQLWIAARGLQASAFVAAPFFLQRRLNVGLAMGLLIVVTASLLWMILGSKTFPSCYQSGIGLTPFKIIAEYVISGMLLLAVGAFLSLREQLERRILILLISSAAVAVLSELSFTAYVGVYDNANLIGHLLKVVSCYLLYRALVVTGLATPYLRLISSEEQLRLSVQWLALLNRFGKLKATANGRAKLFEETCFLLVEDGPFASAALCENGSHACFGSHGNPSHLAQLEALDGEAQRRFAIEGGEGLATSVGDDLTLCVSVSGAGNLADDAPAFVARLCGDLDAAVQAIAAREERTRANQALVASERKYRQLIENTNTVPWELELTNNTFTYVGPQSEKVFGYSPESWVDLDTWAQRIHPDDRAYASEYTRLGTERGEDHDFDYRVLAADGSVRWIHDIVSVVGGADGPVGLIGFMRDITEQKELIQQRTELQTQLWQAQKMEALGTLAGGIAHDFNNILGAIIGFTEMTQSALPDDGEEWENLAEVLTAAERAKQLVQQILTFSRKARQNRVPVDFGETIDDAVKLLRQTIPSGIRLHVDIEPDLPPVVADPTQIHQVLMNLCTNAHHGIGGDTGTIEVNLRRCEVEQHSRLDLTPGEYLRLTIRDDGEGIPESVLPRVLDPFFTTKEPGKGTGMGLAVVHGIVDSLEGCIEIESEEGSGTTVECYFPTTRQTVVKATAPTLAIKHRGHGTVLVVDDEELLVSMLRRTLEEVGYTVLASTSSTEAMTLFLFEPQAIDLVITDQTMPHLSGMEMARQMTALRPELPVIICTGYSDSIDLERARAAGARTLLMKPITRAVLFHTLESTL